ncbi:MAG: hypothetical protein RIR62_186 [Pseudomonadota bacterium]|jgi:outer membrane protein assembly factor BamE (lipoprotein component of BamABCDE complex)
MFVKGAVWGNAAGRVRIAPFLAGVAMLLAVACAPIQRNHGYVPSDQDLALVEVGTDTRETVAEKVGRPSVQGLLNDVGWFYVQSRWETRGARAPQEIDRQVVAISFDEGGRVSNVERFGLERGKIVPLSRRVTEPNVKGMGVIRQLLGNLGRLNAGQLLQD